MELKSGIFWAKDLDGEWHLVIVYENKTSQYLMERSGGFAIIHFGDENYDWPKNYSEFIEVELIKPDGKKYTG